MTLTPDIAAEAADPVIQSLDLSMFDEGDLVNLILQRSEVMFDRPRSGQVIRAWEAGDNAPMQAEVARLGLAVARRAAGAIHAEYRALAPVLAQLKPRRVADIGCGYAFLDLFLARDHDAEVLLIDLEANERRHFGFQAQGAAYSSLAVARRLLEANGIAPALIRTLNPRDEPPEAAGPVDLAVSFLSCGFHYPVDSYLSFLRDAVVPGGAVILDLRMATAAEQAAKLAAFGTLTDLPAPPKARRVMVQKP